MRVRSPDRVPAKLRLRLLWPDSRDHRPFNRLSIFVNAYAHFVKRIRNVTARDRP